MKLDELHTDVLWEGELDGYEYAFVIEEGMARFAQSSKGGVLRGAAKGALKFISNPVVAGLAAGYAIDSINAYKRNKRMTTTFFAKSPEEKKLYRDIVDTLMKTGNYRKVREKYIDGGIMYELKKIH
jgi:hypothetical protein